MAISMLKIRRPLGRLIFNMGIAIPGKTVFLIETAPCKRGIDCKLMNLVSINKHRHCSLQKAYTSFRILFAMIAYLSGWTNQSPAQCKSKSRHNGISLNKQDLLLNKRFYWYLRATHFNTKPWTLYMHNGLIEAPINALLHLYLGIMYSIY